MFNREKVRETSKICDVANSIKLGLSPVLF